MFFILSKVVFFFLTPSNFVWLLGVAGLVAIWRGRVRTGGRLVAAGLALYLVFGFSPLGNLLALPLEERFARSPAELDDPGRLGRIDGIITLGGFEDGRVSEVRGLLGLSEAAERLAETVRLARLLPQANIIFTGGTAALMLEHQDAASAVGNYLVSVGIARSRIVLEAKSRNTWENAVLTREILKPPPGARYLLVTSAWHMPRSIGVFRKAGYDVVAWPVDYRTVGASDLVRPFGNIFNGLERVDTMTKEWIGLVAYYLTGRSSSLWPAPMQAR